MLLLLLFSHFICETFVPDYAGGHNAIWCGRELLPCETLAYAVERQALSATKVTFNFVNDNALDHAGGIELNNRELSANPSKVFLEVSSHSFIKVVGVVVVSYLQFAFNHEDASDAHDKYLFTSTEGSDFKLTNSSFLLNQTFHGLISVLKGKLTLTLVSINSPVIVNILTTNPLFLLEESDKTELLNVSVSNLKLQNTVFFSNRSNFGVTNGSNFRNIERYGDKSLRGGVLLANVDINNNVTINYTTFNDISIPVSKGCGGVAYVYMLSDGAKFGTFRIDDLSGLAVNITNCSAGKTGENGNNKVDGYGGAVYIFLQRGIRINEPALDYPFYFTTDYQEGTFFNCSAYYGSSVFLNGFEDTLKAITLANNQTLDLATTKIILERRDDMTHMYYATEADPQSQPSIGAEAPFAGYNEVITNEEVYPLSKFVMAPLIPPKDPKGQVGFPFYIFIIAGVVLLLIIVGMVTFIVWYQVRAKREQDQMRLAKKSRGSAFDGLQMDELGDDGSGSYNHSVSVKRRAKTRHKSSEADGESDEMEYNEDIEDDEEDNKKEDGKGDDGLTLEDEDEWGMVDYVAAIVPPQEPFEALPAKTVQRMYTSQYHSDGGGQGLGRSLALGGAGEGVNGAPTKEQLAKEQAAENEKERGLDSLPEIAALTSLSASKAAKPAESVDGRKPVAAMLSQFCPSEANTSAPAKAERKAAQAETGQRLDKELPGVLTKVKTDVANQNKGSAGPSVGLVSRAKGSKYNGFVPKLPKGGPVTRASDDDDDDDSSDDDAPSVPANKKSSAPPVPSKAAAKPVGKTKSPPNASSHHARTASGGGFDEVEGEADGSSSKSRSSSGKKPSSAKSALLDSDSDSDSDSDLKNKNKGKRPSASSSASKSKAKAKESDSDSSDSDSDASAKKAKGKQLARNKTKAPSKSKSDAKKSLLDDDDDD